MLYNAHNDYAPYNGEVVNDIRLPGNVEQVWDDDELIGVGLWPHSRIAASDPVPAGKIIVSTHIEEIDGVPTFVNELEDAPPPLPNTSPLSLHTVACAALTVENGEIYGMERSIGLVMAFMLDADTAWLFFEEPQPDTDYIVTPSDGVTKYEDMIEIQKTNATAFRLIVQRLD
jgi:hypothetical protein